MRSVIIGFVLYVLTVSNGTVLASDLSKVDRTIQREPAYRSTPKYCLLVFGPKAEHRVWLVLDGEFLYVDRNGNGDLTDDGEPVKLAKWVDAKKHPMYEKESRTNGGDLSVGGLTHEGLEILRVQYLRKVDPKLKDAEYWQSAVDEIWKELEDGVCLSISLDLDFRCYELPKVRREKNSSVVKHSTANTWKGYLSFAATKDAAPVLHFGGPLTFRAEGIELRRGENKGDLLIVNLGTAGVGRGAFIAAPIEVLPLDANPLVEIAFPSKRPGEPDLIRKFVLNERCCGINIYTRVKVPDEAGSGTAKVKVSFSEWKEVKVVPVTETLQILP
jgi:hypothetical protein